MPKGVEKVYVVVRQEGVKWRLYRVYANRIRAERYCAGCQFRTRIEEMEVSY